jgi:tol-pal system protein YbgF
MIARSLVGVAVAALVAGCVTVPEFRALEREVVELKGGGGPGGPPPEGRLAELGSQVSELQNEVSELRGAVEEARHASQEALEEARAARDAAERSSSVGQGGPQPRYGGGLDPEKSPETVSLSAEVKGYEEAFRLYRAGDYESAIDRFRGFLQTYPSSDYADNALFWLGESHFKLGDHEQAVLAFDDVVKRYPDGNKVPDALYRQAMALLEIGTRGGQNDTYQPAARQIFERLLNEHPDSDRVPEARRQLEKLGQ